MKNCVPVGLEKQCRSNAAARSSSIPPQPERGDSCALMAWQECHIDARRSVSLVSRRAASP